MISMPMARKLASISPCWSAGSSMILPPFSFQILVRAPDGLDAEVQDRFGRSPTGLADGLLHLGALLLEPGLADDIDRDHDRKLQVGHGLATS